MGGKFYRRLATGALGALIAVLLIFYCAEPLISAPAILSNDGAYTVNKMNSISYKYQIGTLIQDALAPGGFAALANGKILVGDGSGTAQAVTPSGDLTMSNTGVFTLAGGGITETTGTLTQANILAMFATPVVLVASPAAGSVIIPESLEWNHVATGTVYLPTSGGKISLGYGTGAPASQTAVIVMNGNAVSGAATTATWIKPSAFDLDSSTGSGSGFNIAAVSGAAFSVTNALSSFASGAATNVVNYRLKYRTVAIP